MKEQSKHEGLAEGLNAGLCAKNVFNQAAAVDQK